MLTEGIDYYVEEGGLFVFTEAYHLKRGYCCQNKCLNCPWHFGKPIETNEEDQQGNDNGSAPLASDY